MHFYELIKQLTDSKETLLFVDMDGVLASYDLGNPFDFAKKRPLLTHIETFRKIKTLKTVELYILSVCRFDYQVQEKNDWLDQHAPFFEPENRIILVKERNLWVSSKELKANYLKTVKGEKQILFIDDDNEVLKWIHHELPHVRLFQDSELID